MYLTDEEKAMLNDDYGQGTALAMKVMVALGECFESERMVEITKSHIALSNQDADLWFAEKMLDLGAHIKSRKPV